MTDPNQEIAREIYDKVGGMDNVQKVYSCMTRVRMKLRDTSKTDIDGLKAIAGVMGVVEDGDTYQAVVGPGKSTKIAEIMAEAAGVKPGDDIPIKTATASTPEPTTTTAEAATNEADSHAGMTNQEIVEAKARAVKDAQKAKRKNSAVQRVLKLIAAIFVPLIPGMVGAGLIAGVGSILSNMITAGDLAGDPWVTIVLLCGLIQKGLFTYLAIYCGINAAKEFGGTAVIGGIIGGISLLPGFGPGFTTTALQPDALDPTKLNQFVNADGLGYQITELPTLPNIFEGGSHSITAGQGGVIGVLVAVWIACLLEKWCHKWVPDSVDIIVTPMIVLICMTTFEIFVIMPLAGYTANGLLSGINWILNVGGPFSGFVLGAAFLPMVMLGLHQILTPIHLEMIASQNMTPLLPILAMAGAGQVGAAMALAVRCRKNKELMTLIKGALPVGILGVGEPLIYGVTLPLGRPFITACLGGGIGGAVIGMIGSVGAIAIGPSGLALIPLIYDGKWLGYIFGLLAGYLGGFILTLFFGIPKDAIQGQTQDRS
ncbi:MAG: PTS transporter subunit EIIC [Bifidobacteriaceae bacterium]|jgi:PTS system sucrose-specific IIC component|nr:PTS transporter subunit EIIC [Bifidobacteriaceae bacterium]